MINLQTNEPPTVYSYNKSKICGERVEVVNDGNWLVVVSNEKPVADATKPGKLLVVSVDSGNVLKTLKISAEIIDLLMIKSTVGK